MKIRNVKMEDSVYRKIIEYCKKNSLTIYTEENVDDLISRVMPNAKPKIREFIKRQLKRDGDPYAIRTKMLRNEMINIIKQTPNLLEELSEEAYIGSLPQGLDLSGVHSTEISKPTENEAILRILKEEDSINSVKAIFKALGKVPEKYRQSVYENTVYGIEFDTTIATARSFKRWKQKFIYWVAEELGYGPIIFILNGYEEY